MLLELHVRNLALIERADIEFYEGLTVLTGETGAGKSILIDSINLALGAKTGKSLIRSGEEYAYVELLFSVDNIEKLEAIRALDIEVEDEGLIAVSRKLSQKRSIIKVNDETVQARKLRGIMSILLDIHGQHEHHSLLDISKHLELVDAYAGKSLIGIKEELKKKYKMYTVLCRELSEVEDKALLERERDILAYEIKELSNANLRIGEEEELESQYRKYKNASKIAESLTRAQGIMEEDNISQALKLVKDAAEYDEELIALASLLSDADALLSDANRQLYDYIKEFEFDEEEFNKIIERLDALRSLENKYSTDIAGLITLTNEKNARLEYIDSLESRQESMKHDKAMLEAELTDISMNIRAIRRASADRLSRDIVKHLEDLNFIGVDFSIDFTELDNITDKGMDSVEFMISTNIGQPRKALKEVASGGELSRIMLAIKTVLADMDAVDTIIFDEVDAGISGRTAQAVAEKLCIIGNIHQVICITHLPQIAAMAEHHYLIEKNTDGISTKTNISYISGEDSVMEIARLIGGSKITGGVVDTAREMKELAGKGRHI